MSCLLILRSETNPGTADQYYLSGTGWQTTSAAGTSYSSKEAAMVDAQTLADAGVGSNFLVVKDLAAHLEFPVQALQP